ncbi:MAG: exodeoxyribonuclease III [Actinomycetaceae bacterium]|nr:exodeoxyribonuclease III [Actinomycetaceae bacterium]
MKIATWNVNSARARHDRIIDVLKRHNLDVLAIQETKCPAQKWDVSAIEALGYKVCVHGINQWNGVGIISRVGLTQVMKEFPQQPSFKDVVEPRALGALCGGVTIWSLYVPHGRALDNPHFTYKLAWLDALRAHATEWLNKDPQAAFILMGDWNIAPLDCDVWDISVFEGDTHVSDRERRAFSSFEDAGLSEVTREYAPGYTYWDYRLLRFVKNEGMKIDFALASPSVKKRVVNAFIDREERKGKGASDHVPVIIELDDTP